ncbi:MAG: glycosyltransferase N-terminal domain-containing protein, partial [Pseudomonadota bacterium]
TLAKLSQRPIVPVAVASNRFIALDTWSRLTLNLPFSRIGVSVGDPITVPRDATPEQLELVRRRVEHAMAEVTERAYRAVGRSHYQAMPAAAMPPEAPPLPLGFRLRAYRALTNIGEPAAPLIIRYRERRGKEPSDRKRERFGYASHTRPDGPLIWFHAASVGETNAILPVLEAVRRNRPDHVMLLTTGTLTSAAIAAERLPTGTIHQFLPLDTRRAVKRFIGYWSPTLAVFTESEIWPNMIVALGAARVPIILANARMSARSYKRWRKSRSAARQLFSRFSLVLAQNEPLARRFRQLGARTVRPAGNIKIDAPRLPVDDAALADFKAALGGRPMWLAASTHEGEELVVLDAHAAAATEHTGLITVIVPRHPDRGDDVAQLARTRGLSVAQRSTGALPDITTEIYVADTLGELGLFYRAAPFAFIGGSIADRGGQNPIEAVRESTGILSGPRTYNFSDAYAALKRSEGARTVADADALAAHVIALLGDDVARARLAEGGSAALSKLTGALDATVAAILDHLDDTDDLRRAS